MVRKEREEGKRAQDRRLAVVGNKDTDSVWLEEMLRLWVVGVWACALLGGGDRLALSSRCSTFPLWAVERARQREGRGVVEGAL